MKPVVTLKEILKPPFNWDCFSNSDKILCGTNNAYCKVIGLQVYGQPFLKHFENGKQLHDEFKDFVVQALNEKWERDRKREKIIEDEEDVYCSDCRHAVINEQGLEWCKEREISVDFDVHEPCTCFEPTNEYMERG